MRAIPLYTAPALCDITCRLSPHTLHDLKKEPEMKHCLSVRHTRIPNPMEHQLTANRMTNLSRNDPTNKRREQRKQRMVLMFGLRGRRPEASLYGEKDYSRGSRISAHESGSVLLVTSCSPARARLSRYALHIALLCLLSLASAARAQIVWTNTAGGNWSSTAI